MSLFALNQSGMVPDAYKSAPLFRRDFIEELELSEGLPKGSLGACRVKHCKAVRRQAA